MPVVARTDIGRVRQANEDFFGTWEFDRGGRLLVGAVADGLGGYAAGEVASSLACRAVETSIASAPADEPLEDVVAAAIRRANDEVYRAARSQPELEGMATTLTCAAVTAGRVVVGHVGDSRAYLIRDGAAEPLTTDHSLVGELVRNGDLTDEEAMAHPQRHILTNALGTHPDVRVDVRVAPVKPGDVILLCSDGLTSLVAAREIPAVLGAAPDFLAAADRLIALANERGGHDNITVLIMGVEPDPGAAQAAGEGAGSA